MNFAPIIDLVSNVTTLSSIFTAAISAKWWLMSSRVETPEGQPSVLAMPGGQPRIINGLPVPPQGIDVLALYTDITAALAHQRATQEALASSARMNAQGARWAMATAALLAVASTAGLAFKLLSQ